MSAPRDPRPLLLGPICRNYGHLFTQHSFFGFPIGRPYCMRCGKTLS